MGPGPVSFCPQWFFALQLIVAAPRARDTETD
jgi:hypothetical protein